jgi:tetratricopeptide (TPR) repeat protein
MHQRTTKRRPFRAPDPARLERHTPFLDVLGRVRVHSHRWYRCRAGLLVLEFLDRVWSSRRTNSDVGVHRRLAVCRAIAAVTPNASRTVLEEVLHLASPGADPQPEALTALMGYGKRLQYESEFRLASHVYWMVVNYANHIEHVELLPGAYEHHGTCMRECGDSQAAIASYAQGLAIATRHRNTRARLRIGCAQANLHRALGDIDQARKVLDPLLHRARTLGVPELLMRAAHERGLVAWKCENYKEALHFYAEAFRNCADPKHRGRLLNDIALSLHELGLVDDAHRTWLASYLATQGDRYAKWVAGVNLLMLAVERKHKDVFDQYAKALARAPMPARLLIEYWQRVGDGSIVFARPSEAHAAWQRAATYAARYGYGEELTRAKRALAGDHEKPRIPPTPPASLTVAGEELLANVRALSSLPGLLGRAWDGDVHAASQHSLRTSLRRGRPRKSEMT